MAVKGKQKGRQFEAKVRKFLQKQGWFVYTKGVSTPGPDILALKDCIVLLFELKTFQQIKDEKVVELGKSLCEHLAKDYWPKLRDAGMKKVLFGALIEIRDKKELWYIGWILVNKENFITKYVHNTYRSLESWFNDLTDFEG